MRAESDPPEHPDREFSWANSPETCSTKITLQTLGVILGAGMFAHEDSRPGRSGWSYSALILSFLLVRRNGPVHPHPPNFVGDWGYGLCTYEESRTGRSGWFYFALIFYFLLVRRNNPMQPPSNFGVILWGLGGFRVVCP